MLYCVICETETAWGMDEEVVFVGSCEACEAYIADYTGDDELYTVEY